MDAMEPHADTAALAATLVTSAAMVVLGLRKQFLVRRRSVCPACRLDNRACRCCRPG